jgi:5-methylcytosine-specific restriction enzyme A
MPSYITDPTADRWHHTRRRVEPLWRSWCKSPTWKSIRRHRLAEEPRCRQCAVEGRTAVAIYVDHVKPHLGQRSLFFQYENTQSLCAHHHNIHKHQHAQQLDVEPLELSLANETLNPKALSRRPSKEVRGRNNV